MVSESVPYWSRLRPLITATLAILGFVIRDGPDLGLAKLCPNYAQDATSMEAAFTWMLDDSVARAV